MSLLPHERARELMRLRNEAVQRVLSDPETLRAVDTLIAAGHEPGIVMSAMRERASEAPTTAGDEA